MPKRTSKPDFNQTIHAIYDRISAGESSHDTEPESTAPTGAPEKPKKAAKVFDPKTDPAKWLGQRGGKKGGATRQASMTPDEKKELAKKAAMARWGKKES